MLLLQKQSIAKKFCASGNHNDDYNSAQTTDPQIRACRSGIRVVGGARSNNFEQEGNSACSTGDSIVGVSETLAWVGSAAPLDSPVTHLWRDCKTTHLLLAVCNAPHEPVEISVAGCAQIEVVYHGSQDPGVRLSQPLGVCLDGKFPGDVLAQETKQVNLF